MRQKSGFTLIELLVVVAIISLLASIVLASLNSARAKGRDARRKLDLKQFSNAMELYWSDNGGTYFGTAGFLNNPNHGGLDTAFSSYLKKISDDPLYPNWSDYIEFRKDYDMNFGWAGCTSANNVNDINRYAFYAKLEKPSSADLATMSDVVDACVASQGYNYKVGN